MNQKAMNNKTLNSSKLSEYKVPVGQSIDLQRFDTKQNMGLDKKQLKQRRNEAWEALEEYQERLYAESKQSVLVVLQAMDAAGKDSTIGKLTTNLNAQGCHIHSFKKPTSLESSHDFLWRVHAKAPANGEITIFNRSHYEDVLIVKVHDWVDEETIQQRYQQINQFESLLAGNQTQVVKFMLHISPEYQLSRFQSRLENPGKNWKFNPGDLDERALWGDYMQAFSSALQHCSTEQAPWYIVPAENRDFRDYMIATVLLETLQAMNPQYPEPEYDASKFKADKLV